MLDANAPVSRGLGIRPEPARDVTPLSLRALLAVLRRQLAIIGAVMLAAVTIAALYLLIAPARYTAVAQLLTDTKRSHSVPDLSGASVNSAVIESQIETIKSEKIALAVISRLKLDQDPEFIEPDLLSRLLVFVGLSSAPTGNILDLRQRKAVDYFGRGLSVVQVGHSYAAVIR